MKKTLAVLLIFFWVAFSLQAAEILLFYSPHCHACHKVIENVVPHLQKAFGRKLRIVLLSVEDEENLRHFLAIEKILGVKKNRYGVVPAMVAGNKILIGRKDIEKSALYLARYAFSSGNTASGRGEKYSLTRYFLSFNLFTVLLAGAVDGINPCAFSCIIFFIAFLSFKGYSRKEIMVIGWGFIFAVFLAYLAIGLGLFSFLYRLKAFYRLIKAFYFIMAGGAFVLSGFSFYDWIRYERNKGNTSGITLQLPYKLKQAIHRLIRIFFGIPRPHRRNFAGLFAASFLSGVLVSLLEAVCTGQVYLPTITFILKNTAFRVRALIYFIAYNLMFILPLVAVFLFSLSGVSSSQFSEFARRHLGLIKLLLAILFLFLGLVLLGGL